MPALSACSLDAVLSARFGLQAFRPWQREAIEAVLGVPGRALVVAPTGGGKSLVYQLPAVVLGGTTLVLSPLVALMEDQVRALLARGIEATFLASTLDPGERLRREGLLQKGAYRLVYAAPERLASDAFVALLERCRIDLVAVDEAHCISHWGHDFRPDYLRIGALLERMRPARVVACTATATPRVRTEIRAQLGLETECVEILRGFARPNLHLAARSVVGPREAREELLACLSEKVGPAKAPKGGAIVYAATRRGAVQYAQALCERGWNAAHYHAGVDPETRTHVARAFADGALDVVVATNAFGMGIDRPDIRAVVHVQPPASIEAYYQEVGRAGRDGATASGLLLCSGADIALRRRLTQMGSDGESLPPAAAARAWQLFRELLCYLDARTCRHDFVLRYFGDEHEVLGGCGHCDICEALSAGAEREEEGTETAVVVRKALSGIARARQRAGISAIVEMLRGVRSDRTERFGFTHLSTFGLLREHDSDFVLALIRALVAAGWVDLTTSDHPVPVLTQQGVEVMRGTGPVRLMLPRAQRPSPRVRAPSGGGGTVMPLCDDARPLFERLRAHRAEIARARRVPPYVVAHDRTLVELATLRPRSRDELSMVYGMGPMRVEEYGEGFLAVLAELS